MVGHEEGGGDEVAVRGGQGNSGRRQDGNEVASFEESKTSSARDVPERRASVSSGDGEVRRCDMQRCWVACAVCETMCRWRWGFGTGLGANARASVWCLHDLGSCIDV